MNEEHYKKSLKIPKMILGWAGIQIYPKNHDRGIVNLLKSWVFLFNNSWLGPVILGEFYWLIEGMYTGQSFDELCTCAPCVTICVLASIKINCLYFNKEVIDNIVEKLRTIHPKDDKEESVGAKDEIGIVKNALKFLNTIVVSCCYLNVIVVIVFGSASILSMAYGYINTGSTELKLPFRIKYFFEVSTLSRWPLVYVHQVGAMIIATIDLISTDVLFYVFCTYLQMHFQLLCLKFEDVVCKSNDKKLKRNLKKAVKRHQELIELVEQIELLYSKSTLCNIILSSLLICLSGFIVTFVRDVGVVSSFVTFLAMNLTQISLLCYFGDMLNFSSTRVPQALYNSLWYDAEVNIKKSIILIIIRAQKPCKVTAMKFADLNVNALSAILRTSWSYFALLKTMYD